MKTVDMGRNTDPSFYKVEEVYRRFKKDGLEENFWLCYAPGVIRSLQLKQEIKDCVEQDGEVALSWSCTGRTKHEMLAKQWATVMPQYDFDINYDHYRCIVRKKKA